jgi:uncharacterized protein (TIGR02145 family)
LISFAGTGASTTVDSVNVENLTQCTETTLGGSDTLHLTESAGINELNTVADNPMHIYPNPMTGACSIDFEATAQGKTTIGLYDMTGKRILQVQELLSKGHHIYRLSGISSGIYTLKIKSDKYSYAAKIISSNATIGTTEIKHIGTTSGIDKQSAASNLPTGQADTKRMSSLKSGSLINMQYTTGDILKLTGKSGNCQTIFILEPTENQTVSFNFVTCTDASSNHYAVVQIGTQMWMAENLKTIKYSNSDLIPNVTDNTQWSNLTTGAFCNYNNTTNTDTINTYGRLYNWHAVDDSRGIAPAGWHVPTDTEWTTLTTYLGGTFLVGGKMKENCTLLWTSPNTGATNESGFSGLPSGNRWNSDGIFYHLGSYSNLWSATEYDVTNAWIRCLSFDDATVVAPYVNKAYGVAVRCIMD